MKDYKKNKTMRKSWPTGNSREHGSNGRDGNLRIRNSAPEGNLWEYGNSKVQDAYIIKGVEGFWAFYPHKAKGGWIGGFKTRKACEESILKGETHTTGQEKVEVIAKQPHSQSRKKTGHPKKESQSDIEKQFKHTLKLSIPIPQENIETTSSVRKKTGKPHSAKLTKRKHTDKLDKHKEPLSARVKKQASEAEISGKKSGSLIEGYSYPSYLKGIDKHKKKEPKRKKSHKGGAKDELFPHHYSNSREKGERSGTSLLAYSDPRDLRKIVESVVNKPSHHSEPTPHSKGKLHRKEEAVIVKGHKEKNTLERTTSYAGHMKNEPSPHHHSNSREKEEGSKTPRLAHSDICDQQDRVKTACKKPSHQPGSGMRPRGKTHQDGTSLSLPQLKEPSPHAGSPRWLTNLIDGRRATTTHTRKQENIVGQEHSFRGITPRGNEGGRSIN